MLTREAMERVTDRIKLAIEQSKLYSDRAKLLSHDPVNAQVMALALLVCEVEVQLLTEIKQLQLEVVSLGQQLHNCDKR